MRRSWRFQGLVLATILIMAGGIAASALDDETRAAIQGAAAIGSVVARGELEPGAASDVVKSLRAGGMKNSDIRDVFRAIRDDEAEPHAAGSRGLGAFVQDAHARGLKGKALADAIHAEQARRGVPGQVLQHDKDLGIVTHPGPDNRPPSAHPPENVPGHATGNGASQAPSSHPGNSSHPGPSSHPGMGGGRR